MIHLNCYILTEHGYLKVCFFFFSKSISQERQREKENHELDEWCYRQIVIGLDFRRLKATICYTLDAIQS